MTYTSICHTVGKEDILTGFNYYTKKKDKILF